MVAVADLNRIARLPGVKQRYRCALGRADAEPGAVVEAQAYRQLDAGQPPRAAVGSCAIQARKVTRLIVISANAP